jgi:hypothetical protein
MSPRSTFRFRRISATWHRIVGWVDFRLGRWERARWHFERVLQLVGDDFSAYLHLGRVAYRLGDYAGWRRECGHAQRTAPQRYARLRHAFDLAQPRAAGALVGPGETWQSPSFRVSRVGTNCSEARVTPDAARGNLADGELDDSTTVHRSRHRYGDDFRDDHERIRFQGLPPIRPADLARVDLDELTQQLGN